MKKHCCDYCGEPFDAALPRCPHCGGPNRLAARSAAEAPAPEPPVPEQSETPARKGVKKPKTVDELRAFAEAHRLPLDEMRVHLGEDYRGAKAYGIYRDENGDFVVYKNKADGTRAVRYQGPDEAHAVEELYLKMKERVGVQKQIHAAKQADPVRQASLPVYDTGSGSGAAADDGSFRARLRRHVQENRSAYVLLLIFVLIIFLIYLVNRKAGTQPRRGYYRYDSSYYYCQGDDWYRYDDDDWVRTYPAAGLLDHSEDYFQSSGYSYAYGVDQFDVGGNSYAGNNNWYRDDNDDDDDWDWDWDDNDWDWDDGGWDDGGDDWDSDW